SQPTKIEIGKPLVLSFIVENNGTTEIRNAQLRIEIPPECRNAIIPGAAFPSEAWISPLKDYAYSEVASIPVKGFAYVRIELPNLPPQGYRIVGTLFVNGQQFNQTTKLIVAGR
ncbi:MAG: hypothetical protein LBQ50_09265, partial [Planctomycetaceae bacterium]|nr:hypothetical protein [Planctomycetaceae bacterium]